MRYSWMVILATVCLLSGCSSDPAVCDPSDHNAGFLTKFNCNFSGDYDRRITGKQLQLENEQALNEHFTQVYEAINKEKIRTRSQVQRRKSENTLLNKSLNSLLAELKQKAQGEQTLETQIDQIQAQLKAFDENSDETIEAKQIDLEKLRNQVFELQRDLGLR